MENYITYSVENAVKGINATFYSLEDAVEYAEFLVRRHTFSLCPLYLVDYNTGEVIDTLTEEGWEGE